MQNQQQHTSSFEPPPTVQNVRGETRKAGFEMEYAGLSIGPSARLVQDVFGGDIEVVSTFVHNVHTSVGKFSVEIDASLLKNKAYEKPLRALGYDPDQRNMTWLESKILDAASLLVPIEIAAPPIAIDQLDPLDDLRQRLLEAGAKGTRRSVLYAFGMHINPEVPDPRDAAALRDMLRAFLLLFPWLKQQVDVNISRRVVPYINPFPAEYVQRLLQPDYPEGSDRFIDDYLQSNATRNRPLDLLPALACLDEQRVTRTVEDPHLVKPRPAYHYRLPNCLIDEHDWSLAKEWHAWVIIERLASDRAKLGRMSWEFLRAEKNALRPIIDEWPNMLPKYVEELCSS
jgi:hypothetical protein